MTPRDDLVQLQEEGDQTAEEPGGGPRVPEEEEGVHQVSREQGGRAGESKQGPH